MEATVLNKDGYFLRYWELLHEGKTGIDSYYTMCDEEDKKMIDRRYSSYESFRVGLSYYIKKRMRKKMGGVVNV